MHVRKCALLLSTVSVAHVFALVGCSVEETPTATTNSPTASGGTAGSAGSTITGGASDGGSDDASDSSSIDPLGCKCDLIEPGPCTPGEIRGCPNPTDMRWKECSCDGKTWSKCNLSSGGFVDCAGCRYGCPGPCIPGEIRNCDDPNNNTVQQCACDGSAWSPCVVQPFLVCDAGGPAEAQ